MISLIVIGLEGTDTIGGGSGVSTIGGGSGVSTIGGGSGVSSTTGITGSIICFAWSQDMKVKQLLIKIAIKTIWNFNFSILMLLILFKLGSS
jgi:hypothetical protein